MENGQEHFNNGGEPEESRKIEVGSKIRARIPGDSDGNQHIAEVLAVVADYRQITVVKIKPIMINGETFTKASFMADTGNWLLG